MNIDAVLESLVGFAENDWIGLWLIVADVADELAVGDSQAQLEATVAVVRGLLRRGFLAGESPVRSSVHFVAWPDQDPDAVVDLIRRQWAGNADYPAWGDCPWFAAPRTTRLDA
jgi:hypothetical protein